MTAIVALGDLHIEYERFFSVSLDMLCISSYDGHFKKVNPAFEETLGFSSDELCTKSYLDFIHPDDIERTAAQVESQLRTKQMVLHFENRYRCKDGSYKWLSWKSAPVGDFMYAVARDVTETKAANAELIRAKEELEIANRELEAFSYSAAHDLQGPARRILSFTAMVLEDPESTLGEASKSYLRRVAVSAKRMGNLIDGLFDLSRLSKKALFKQPVDLSKAAEEAAEDLRFSNPDRRVEFVIAENVVVNGDPVLMKAVIVNLIGNAWKYSARSARDVTIAFGSTEEKGERVVFVRDNGAGFDMMYASKLFGVFQRFHSNEEFEGAGIGLATVERIIQRHGGRIWATGAVDGGATFYFTIE